MGTEWNVGGNKKITLAMNGDTRDYSYDASSSLAEAVRDIAQKNHLASVSVMHDGEDVGPSEGGKPLSSFDGELEVTPKAQGASQW